MSAEPVHHERKQDSGKLTYVLLLLIALGAAAAGWLWWSRAGASASSLSHPVLHLDTFVLNLSDRDDHAYLQVWADTFANIVADLSGTSTTCEVLQDLTTEKPELENSLFAHGTISGAIAGAFSFRIPQATVGELMRTKEEVAGKEARDPAGVLKEIFERAAGQVSSHVALSHAVQDVSNQAPTDLEAAQSYWFRLNTAPACVFELQMDSGCAAALESRPLGKDADEAPIAGEARSPEENLEVLKHVELAVSIRFGGRRMLLKDILDLSAGSIVELDQQIQQPVDLLLDGRLIARGEVVVVEGNYGLRVTEVLANVAN